jgi:hypothetical protein
VVALRSVVKHSYLTGQNRGMARAQAHIKYIQFRSGKDKDSETRSFFDGERDDVNSGEVRNAVSRQNERSTVMHKLILSPGVQGADVKEYCREVMADLGSRKGLELQWYGVRHDNTSHPHVHIVIMGADENGHKVRLSKDDYTKIKEAGDRYLERNKHIDRDDKDKDREVERGPGPAPRAPAAKIFSALKAAAREFSRVMKDDKVEAKPENRFERRRREKEEERQEERDRFGDPIDMNEYLQKQIRRDERGKVDKEKAWKDYCEPINVPVGPEKQLKAFDRSTPLNELRQLERASRSDVEDKSVNLSEKDQERLVAWIKEKHRDEKQIEAKADRLESIEIGSEEEGRSSWTPDSSLEELRKLEDMNSRGQVYLDKAEISALGNWVKEQEYKEPIFVQLEPGAEPFVYDRDDSKESLQFLTREYEKGEQWVLHAVDEKDYRKVKGWIRDKDREKEQKEKDRPVNLIDGDPYDMNSDSFYRTEKLELLKAVEEQYRAGDVYARSMGEDGYERLTGWITDAEKDPSYPIKFGQTEDGKDRYLSAALDKEVLVAAREELQKEPEKHEKDIQKIDQWIANPKIGQKKKTDKVSRDEEVATNQDDEKIEYGKREFSKYTPLKDLQDFRTELKNASYDNWLPPQQFSELCSWIGTKEKYGDDCFGKLSDKKDKSMNKSDSKERAYGDKEPRVHKRKRSALEKRMERAVREDKTARFTTFYNEKALHRDRLSQERANLQAQVRALNKYEKERETVDGQYSEIWGADKSGIAAGAHGAASGGARPLGANQFVRLITQAKKNFDVKQKMERENAAKTQRGLEEKLTQDKKTEKSEKPAPMKPFEKPKIEKSAGESKSAEPVKAPQMPALDNEKVETDTRELGKEIKNRKKKEQDRDQRPGSDKGHDPFIHDPWGRW